MAEEPFLEDPLPSIVVVVAVYVRVYMCGHNVCERVNLYIGCLFVFVSRRRWGSSLSVKWEEASTS